MSSAGTRTLMFSTGDKVHSRYEIIKSLGTGGMGSVWLASDNTAKNFNVALKVLDSDGLLSEAAAKGVSARDILDFDRQLRELFLREARAMKRLAGHSNIVSVFDIAMCPKANDNADVIYYMVLEYIEGRNGESLIEQKVYESDFPTCLKVALKVCRGLSYAHENGVLHRDVKPNNILLGKNGVVKIGDFGLAKIVSEGFFAFTAPYAGAHRYKAPEQRAPHPVTDQKTDIYQFGATLFHLFTGLSADHHGFLTGLPAEKKSDLEPKAINPRVSKSVSDLIMEMLHKEPERRPTLEHICETLEKEVHPPLHDTRNLDRYRTPIIDIRRALKERVVTEFDYIKNNANLIPGRKKPQVWYATFLLRPLLPMDNGEQKLADYFTLIYFAEYTGKDVTATADWDDDPALTMKRLRINDCCSGLPIRWYIPHDRDSWRDLYGDEFSTFHFERGRLQYLILYDVKKARFDPGTSDNLIRANYATADAVQEWEKAVGWDLRDNKTKASKKMSQNIQTEIIVPVYSLASGSVERPKNEVLGVVNFEWDQPMSYERREEVAEQIVDYIQKENIFAITYFTCDVLYNITLPEDNP